MGGLFKTAPALFIPPFAYDVRTRPGTVNLLADPATRRRLGIVLGVGGGRRGYHTEADINTTADGTDWNALWDAYIESLRIYNAERQALIDFLTYQVTVPFERVPQGGDTVAFEEASEFGVPVAVRVDVSEFTLGYSFKWYDTGVRFTWKFLAENNTAQIDAVNNAIIEADNRNMFLEVMRTLFRNTNRTAQINGQPVNVYALYNADGTVPPPYKSNTFDGTHNHYMFSGAGTMVSGDVDDMQDNLTHHGYSASNGYDLVLMVNKQEGDILRNFRSIANGGTARYDFIPAQGQPSFLLPDNFRTPEAGGSTRAPATLRGLGVIGSYGEFTIVQEDYVPAGYMIGFATGGAAGLGNPIGLREHVRPELRGLRLVRGRVPDYPLVESYYQHGFGTGIRQRGGAVVMRIHASAYAPPTEYAG